MYSMDYSKLGERIREERLKRHVTQAELAEAVDISTTYIGQIERGEKSLTLDTLVKIVNYFDVTVDYLLRDSLEEYHSEDIDEWNRLITGKSTKERQAMIDIIKKVNDFKTI